MSEINSTETMTDVLKEKGAKKYAEVWTEDNKQIGVAIRLYHRTRHVNSELKLYATYLECMSVPMGGTVFIPTDFVADYDAAANKIMLSVKMSFVQRETWDRTPDFIAHRTSETEELGLTTT